MLPHGRCVDTVSPRLVPLLHFTLLRPTYVGDGNVLTSVMALYRYRQKTTLNYTLVSAKENPSRLAIFHYIATSMTEHHVHPTRRQLRDRNKPTVQIGDEQHLVHSDLTTIDSDHFHIADTNRIEKCAVCNCHRNRVRDVAVRDVVSSEWCHVGGRPTVEKPTICVVLGSHKQHLVVRRILPDATVFSMWPFLLHLKQRPLKFRFLSFLLLML
ncbi:hypothetical protein PsorP6_015262 [Peronosclerospora sorghi]|uniref:Uncharacterized protein n=1 Tax=Peronosclerospora sorghi TaxID=230839 RepID=A0ACC0VTR3_9STRA|nr:hypothetical protein PsorP6_015262 [Peronosclerospora sorghi]